MPPFKQIDVFTSEKHKGNPVAVFFDAAHLSSEEMQRIANWTNLSETTFVLPPTDTSKADYRLRIFTPAEELPFAGHPTIGSAHAVIESGLVTPIDGLLKQECGAGIVELRHDSQTGKIEFRLPHYVHSEIADNVDKSSVLKALGSSLDRLEHFVDVNDGPDWVTIKLKSAEDVSRLEPDFGTLKELSLKYGYFGFSIFGPYDEVHPTYGLPMYEARNFFLLEFFAEDPVCGSGAGADASLLAELEGFEGEFIVKQGKRLGRDGTIFARVEKVKNGENDYSIYVSGSALTCIHGSY